MPNMPCAPLGHFGSLLIFALFVSVAIGSIVRRSAVGRIRYVLWSFVLFVLVSIGIAWLMYPFSR
ncbi:MAG TPA: hypothetical protein VEJ67_05875 [Candidatus Cybelea sp.]|nr:hypothetical protein [Candidatus Cybelea sp.]